MTKFWKIAAVASFCVAGLAQFSVAHASTISVGLQEAGYNGGAIQTIGTSTTGFLSTGNVMYGTFMVNSITAQDPGTLVAPDLLDSQSLQTSSSTAGQLTVYVTTTGLTTPIGVQNLLSTFTANNYSQTFSITEASYYSDGGSAYAMTNLLALTAMGRSSTATSVNAATLTNPFTLTEVYTITATGSGNSNLTIDVSSVPEPASMALLGSGLVGVGALRRRRRRA